jgi:hypothetical protein
MAKTVSRITVQASATNTAGSTTTSSYVDISSYYNVEIVGKISNGGTGPTIACTVYIEVADSSDANPIRIGAAVGSTTNSASVTFRITVPAGSAHLRSVFTGNTGQSVTIEAYAESVTAV